MKPAKRPNYSSLVIALAGCVALIYVMLLAMSAGCALAHTDGVHHHHHHGDEGSSAADQFCVWACQATADTVADGGSPLAVMNLVSGPAEFTSTGLLLSIDPSAMHSRAPLSISFVRLG